MKEGRKGCPLERIDKEGSSYKRNFMTFSWLPLILRPAHSVSLQGSFWKKASVFFCLLQKLFVFLASLLPDWGQTSILGIFFTTWSFKAGFDCTITLFFFFLSHLVPSTFLNVVAANRRVEWLQTIFRIENAKWKRNIFKFKKWSWQYYWHIYIYDVCHQKIYFQKSFLFLFSLFPLHLSAILTTHF